MKQVTAAIIQNDGKILIARRGPDDDLAGKWEFPGGKIEPGETPEQCLVREIKEELGIEIKIAKFYASSDYHYHSGSITLLAYIAIWEKGDVCANVHDLVIWVKPEKLCEYDFAPADTPIVEKLRVECFLI